MAKKATEKGKDMSEDTVSEECVCVEFCASIDSQLFDSNEKTIKFLGLDSDQVMVQMRGSGGNAFFSGQMEDMFGTNVLFEIKDKPIDGKQMTSDLNDNKTLHYIGKCDQKLVMKRVFLEPQENHSSDHQK